MSGLLGDVTLRMKAEEAHESTAQEASRLFKENLQLVVSLDMAEMKLEAERWRAEEAEADRDKAEVDLRAALKRAVAK